MKKAIGIIILGLLWCNTGFAITQQSAIDNWLKGRKLDTVEGIWLHNGGRVSAIYKVGNSYTCVVIKSDVVKSGTVSCSLSKGSEMDLVMNLQALLHLQLKYTKILLKPWQFLKDKVIRVLLDDYGQVVSLHIMQNLKQKKI